MLVVKERCSGTKLSVTSTGLTRHADILAFLPQNQASLRRCRLRGKPQPLRGHSEETHSKSRSTLFDQFGWLMPDWTVMISARWSEVILKLVRKNLISKYRLHIEKTVFSCIIILISSYNMQFWTCYVVSSAVRFPSASLGRASSLVSRLQHIHRDVYSN